MQKNFTPRRSLVFSIHMYQILLAIYPFDFRHEYGNQMCQVFRDCVQRTLRESGQAGLLSLWGRTMLDTVKTAIEEHARRGVNMSQETYLKLSGWAFILSGLILPVSGMAAQRPAYDHYNAASLRIDQYANVVAFPLMTMGILLLIAGCIGLYMRYGHRAGRFGQFSLSLSIFAGIIGVIGLIRMGSFTNDTAWGSWWVVSLLGMAFQCLGIALFGISALRQHLLAHWNGLPIFAGIWAPLYVIVAIGMLWTGIGWPESQLLNLLVSILTMAGFVSLGYEVLTYSQAADTIAPAG